jgi:hypothetical protein
VSAVFPVQVLVAAEDVMVTEEEVEELEFALPWSAGMAKVKAEKPKRSAIVAADFMTLRRSGVDPGMFQSEQQGRRGRNVRGGKNEGLQSKGRKEGSFLKDCRPMKRRKNQRRGLDLIVIMFFFNKCSSIPQIPRATKDNSNPRSSTSGEANSFRITYTLTMLSSSFGASSVARQAQSRR